jgi:hypothetical protein
MRLREWKTQSATINQTARHGGEEIVGVERNKACLGDSLV